MKTLQIDEKKARVLYKSASPEFKATLEDSFGKDFFFESIKDRIKSFEDACEYLGLDSNDLPDTTRLDKKDGRSIVAFYKLQIIARALNEGWTPDWSNSNQYKYWPYFDLSSGFGFSRAGYYYVLTNTSVSAHLCLKTRDLALYFGRSFTDLWIDYLTISQ